MAHQIIKQPDGNYCIWSTITDSIIGKNIPRQDLIDYYRKEAADRVEESTVKILDLIEGGVKPYYQFTKTYDDVKSFMDQDEEE